MIVVTIDASSSINNVINYTDTVLKIVSSFSYPLRLIIWNDICVKNKTLYKFDKEKFIFKGNGKAFPQCFLKGIPLYKSFDLHVITTDGNINETDILESRNIIERKGLNISNVYLHYINSKNNICFGLLSVFRDFVRQIYVNTYYVGQVETSLPSFENINSDYIMKDDSFKMSVLHHMSLLDKSEKYEMKLNICKLRDRILNDPKYTIDKFYVEKNVEGCISYVKTNLSIFRNFQKVAIKMNEILNFINQEFAETFQLYYPSWRQTNYYSQRKPTKVFYLNLSTSQKKSLPTVEKNYPIFRSIYYSYKDLICKDLKVLGIPLKEDKYRNRFDSDILRNPFKILESDFSNLIYRVAPVVVNISAFYKHDTQSNTSSIFMFDSSPFLQDSLKSVYLLHVDGMDYEVLRYHNKNVLSKFITYDESETSVLWNIIFLYILALSTFKEIKDILFKEIQFLGNYAKDYITLDKFSEPTIISNLNTCFWYIANVCHKAFPNSNKNILRKDFISGDFLTFYKNVYDTNYEWPSDMYIWQLWYNLITGKLNIFKILSFYFDHEKIKDSILLYRDEKKSEIPKEFSFLYKINLETILNVYSIYLKSSNGNYFQDLTSTKGSKIVLYDKHDDIPCLLNHIQINPKTGHPYLTCKVTGKYWKECIGPYDRTKHSYVLLFKKYCKKYRNYPGKTEDLCVLLNESLYEYKNKVPELFSKNLKNELKLVMEMFEEVMKMYTCEEYIKLTKIMWREETRKLYE